GGARQRTGPAGPAHAGRRALPGRRVDAHRLAGHDGGGRAQRPDGRGRAAARSRDRSSGEGGGMTVQLKDTRADTRRRGLDLAVEHLLAQQSAAGFWKGELETNVTIDAEDLFLRHYLGLLDAHQVEATARWIRSKQRADGSWATFYGGPADVSTSAEAYLALRLAGDDPEAEHMRRASSFVREAGGLEATR